jgi:hypothetical protein
MEWAARRGENKGKPSEIFDYSVEPGGSTIS